MCVTVQTQTQTSRRFNKCSVVVDVKLEMWEKDIDGSPAGEGNGGVYERWSRLLIVEPIFLWKEIKDYMSALD